VQTTVERKILRSCHVFLKVRAQISGWPRLLSSIKRWDTITSVSASKGTSTWLTERNHYTNRTGSLKSKLRDQIEWAANWSRVSKRPLITTECWSLVDYKDWPLLEWGWLKELCEVGARTAASTLRWVAMATSNFCGAQFVGMW
jgi:Sugar-binding cellulase-like